MKDTIISILLLVNICSLLFFGFKMMSPVLDDTRPIERIVSMDTILPAPIIVQMPKQRVPAPQVIYVDRDKNIVPIEEIDTSKHLAANVYQDSLEDENLTLYYDAVVDGELLHNNLNYKLKIPTQITKTIEITKPVPMPVHSIMLTGAVGANPSAFASVRLGAEFVSAKGWSLGYDYDVLQNVHSVNLGVRLVRFESKNRF